MFDSMFPSHWTTLRKLMWLKLKGASAVWETISGNPVSFTALAAPLRKLSIAFSPVQEGSGDPSPDNVRPISGWSSLTVYHSGADTSNPQTISINLGQAAYSGALDVLTGVLTVTSKAKAFSEMTWVENASANTFNGTGFAERETKIDGSVELGCYCDSYPWYTSGEVTSHDYGIALANSNSGSVANRTRIYVKDIRYATVSDFVASFQNFDPIVVCPLSEPVSIQLTPQQVSSLLGENNMWSDANGNLTVTFAADPATLPIVGKGKVGQAVI